MHCQENHANRDHLPVLRQLAKQCSSVTEVGKGQIHASWGLFQGLTESPFPAGSYLGIHRGTPSAAFLKGIKEIVEGVQLSFRFWHVDDLQIDRLEPTDLLFLDSLSTYYHLSYELETFSSQVRKYIVVHNTDTPFGHQNDPAYQGSYSEYFSKGLSTKKDQIKQGLWPAVMDFLANHREWEMQEHRTNCGGLTILKRVL